MDRAFILLLLVGACYSLLPFPDHWGYNVQSQVSEEVTTQVTDEVTTQVTEEVTTQVTEEVPIAECPSPWFRVGTQCFLASGIGHNWSSARAYCSNQAPGGDLAQPIDIKALVDYFKAYGNYDSYHGDLYWLGGSDLETEGDWRWLNGAIIYRGWMRAADWDQSSLPFYYPKSVREDQPNDYRSGQDCLSVEIYRLVPSANSMGDLECDSRLYFFCERH